MWDRIQSSLIRKLSFWLKQKQHSFAKTRKFLSSDTQWYSPILFTDDLHRGTFRQEEQKNNYHSHFHIQKTSTMFGLLPRTTMLPMFSTNSPVPSSSLFSSLLYCTDLTFLPKTPTGKPPLVCLDEGDAAKQLGLSWKGSKSRGGETKTAQVSG